MFSATFAVIAAGPVPRRHHNERPRPTKTGHYAARRKERRRRGHVSSCRRSTCRGNPITQIAVGRAAKGDPLKAVFQVPINVWLPSGVKLVYDEKEPGIAAAFKRCVPAACLSDIDLKDDMIKKLRARSENGRIEFKDSAQPDVAIPVSFKGFGAALDAMPKE